jgi:hypothetical protein
MRKTSHLLCKNRHAAFGLKRFIFLKRAFLEIFKASSKEGMITKIRPSSLKAHLTGTQRPNLGAFLDPAE